MRRSLGALGLILLAGCGLQPQPMTSTRETSVQAREVVPPNVSVAEVQAMLTQDPGLVLLDVRKPEEYAAGHIAGARLMPMNQVFKWSKTLDPRAHYVCVCAVGARSGMTAGWLLNTGKFAHVENMDGGLTQWVAAGYPVVTGSRAR